MARSHSHPYNYFPQGLMCVYIYTYIYILVSHTHCIRSCIIPVLEEVLKVRRVDNQNNNYNAVVFQVIITE